MDQHLGFLQAIRDRPGSSIPRLVYADWLSERDDPRGEFIRCQVQACRLPRASPQRLALEAQAHELLLAHEEHWLGPLLDCIGDWQWQGGLLDSVSVRTDRFLAHAESWLPTLPLLGVHLRKARDGIAELARCPQLIHLRGLYLGDNDLTDDDLAVLLTAPYLQRLRSLFLQSNKLTAEGIRILAQSPHLPRLRELCLDHNRCDDAAVAHLAQSPHLKRLRKLNLSMGTLETPGVQALADAPLLARLRMLGLGINLLPAGALASLVRAPGFANLRTLSYYMNRPDTDDIVALADSPYAASLRHVSLDMCQGLGDRALVALARSAHLGQLRFLSLGPASWGAAGVRALGRSRTLASLRTLQLTPNKDRAVCAALLGQPLIRRLRHLQLEVHEIGAAGLAALASHRRPLRLLELQVPLAPELAESWQTLLARQMLPRLTDLTLVAAPPGSLRAMLEPGCLPELRGLTLYGLADLDEFQALLDSPLLRRLHRLRIELRYDQEQQQELEVIRRLSAAWNGLRQLGLLWSLTPAAARLLADSSPPPALTELDVGAFRLKTEGMAALAGWPGLRQLRHLVLRNTSSQAVPGLEALAASAQVGPLLRVDIRNGHVPKEVMAVLRRRFGTRFAIGGRMGPRLTVLGGWHHLLGDGED